MLTVAVGMNKPEPSLTHAGCIEFTICFESFLFLGNLRMTLSKGYFGRGHAAPQTAALTSGSVPASTSRYCILNKPEPWEDPHVYRAGRIGVRRRARPWSQPLLSSRPKAF